MNDRIFRLATTVPPASLPLGLGETKAALGIADDETLTDALLLGHIRAATEACEAATGRALITRTLTLWRDAWPGAAGEDWPEGTREGVALAGANSWLALPRPPLQSVTYVRTWDESDVATTWAASAYVVDTAGAPGRIVPRSGQSWPAATRAANGIEIRYVAGYGDDPHDVPQALRDGMLAFVAALHDGGAELEGRDAATASGAARLWSPYRVLSL